jgi:hypothetical protein
MAAPVAMMSPAGVVALDGHDGAGKTTLALALAERLSGVYARPFHGKLGAALLAAGATRDVEGIISIGEEGIHGALATAGTDRTVVLDRGWMTVASLIDRDAFDRFAARWRLWMPTALCWADLRTTLVRLAPRLEQGEPSESHAYYLEVYRGLAGRTGSLILRTDINSHQLCVQMLCEWAQDAVPHPR